MNFVEVAWPLSLALLVAALVVQGWPRRTANRREVAMGIRFGILLVDPRFREYLAALGWRHGDRMYPAVPGTQAVELLSRRGIRNGRSWLALTDPDAPFGLRFLFVTEPTASDSPIEVTLTRDGATLWP